MKDTLLDIVKYTYSLGEINLVKVVGSEEETKIYAKSENNAVIIEATFNNPVPDFVGVFGMPNLGKLNTILNTPEYKEHADISVTHTTNGEGVRQLTGIHFKNKVGDFTNDYRLMSSAMASELVKTSKTRVQTWDIEVMPSVQSIQRLKFQTAANSEEQFFSMYLDKNNLMAGFGDSSTHSGKFIFHSPVTGRLTKSWMWPVAVVNNILSLSGDKTLKINDVGIALISVDSGLAQYNYYLPANTK